MGIKKTMAVVVAGTAAVAGGAAISKPLDVTAATSSQVQQFINSNRADVINVTNKYGLYASVQMAQAALESSWGLSTLSTQANNYFGIKQTNTNNPNYWADTLEWSNGKWVTIKAPFVKYASRYDSLEANAKLLRNGLTWDSGYYSGTWKSKAKTYADAANALTGKYATDPSYGSKLINIIKTYNLTELDKPAKTGYLQDSDGQWYWFESGVKYTGFRSYMGTYYYFINGVRQENQWVSQWGLQYYVGNDGRAVEGVRFIDGVPYDFGTNGTFNLKGKASGYLYDVSPANGGYRWYEKGSLYTGFRYYMGTYYWFVNGVRQNEGWREAWGYKYWTNKEGRAVQGWQTINGQRYYFGNDGTYYLR